MNELTTIDRPIDGYRMSTDAAGACGAIVKQTASEIQGRRYVSVEGWQAIAIAHGCTAGSRDVERVEGGIRAVGEVRRMSDGTVIAVAEGFVGEDEPTWFGGKMKRWKWGQQRGEKIWYEEDMPKRPDYAIRAMAQTRAISRACRSAFAHVVVMIDAGLSTTPAEEMQDLPPHDAQTGEIIEAEAIREPAPRTKLDGPHTSKTALREAVNEVIAKVRKVETIEDLEKVKSDNKRTINQALRDWPALVNGDPRIAEDIGLKGVIEMKRGELTRSLQYQMLVSCVNECETSKDLQTFINQHGEAVGELDGEESRLFEELYDTKAAALKALDNVRAG